MTEPPSPKARPDEIADQLDKTAADLRTLGEQLGAIPVGPPRTVSRRRAQITFAAVVGLAALVAWFIWDQWHSLLPALAPLVWIFWRGWRWRHRALQREPQPPA